MRRDIKKLNNGTYDLLVVGGGILGASIANMASRKGMKVALLEKGDFASGASSKSTKLMHGGLRYLEQGSFGLVKQALKERFVHLKSTPHLVKPLSFIIPVYESDKRPLWYVRMGVWIYDILSGKYNIQKHEALSKEAVLEKIPGIIPDGLVGGVMYYDAQMDDARICLENVLQASQQSAHISNYIEVKSFIQESGRCVGVKAVDLLSNERMEIRAKNVVCAVGQWANEVVRKEHRRSTDKVRLTKGVHLIYKGQLSEHAMLLPIKKDKRIFFVVPWYGHSLIGTTDTSYTGDPDSVMVDAEDVDYLLNALKRAFPKKKIRNNDIIVSIAGLRSLVNAKGPESSVSREHIIDVSFSGVVYALGGKFTTYRKIAEEVLLTIDKRRNTATDYMLPLYSQAVADQDKKILCEKYDIDPETMTYLVQRYGDKCQDIFSIIEQDKKYKQKLCTCSPAISAQVIYSIQVEMAQTLEDIVDRRLGLIYYPCTELTCRKKIKEMLKNQ